MKAFLLVAGCFIWVAGIGQPLVSGTASGKDWLVTPIRQSSVIYRKGGDVILDNGLVRRVLHIGANVACIDYTNLSNGQQLLRSVKPEARLVLDGKEYNVGGMYGQQENGYLLREWVDSLKAGPADFSFVGYSVADLQPFLHWKSRTWAMSDKAATGKVVSFEYRASASVLKGLKVVVHYELYDGLPLIVKWISIMNEGAGTFKLDRVVNEVLGLVEEESAVVGKPEEMKK